MLLLSIFSFATKEVITKRSIDYQYNELIQRGFSGKEALNFIAIDKLINEPDKYILALKAEINKHPNNYLAYDKLGEAYRTQKSDPENAIKNFKISVLANRKGYYAFNKLGNLYLNKKDIKTAQVYFENLKKNRPDFPGGFHGLGIVHALNSEFMEAFNDISTAKNLYKRLDGTKYFEIYRNRGKFIQECDILLDKIKAGAFKEYSTKQIDEEI